MKANIDGGRISFDLYDLIESAAKEQRAEIIDALACQTEVIDEVMAQVFDGYTSLCSYGLKGGDGSIYATNGIDGARARIALMAGEIAQKRIAALIEEVKREKKSAEYAWDKYHARGRGEFA